MGARALAGLSSKTRRGRARPLPRPAARHRARPTAVAGLGDRLEEARRAADPEGDVPAVTMAAAVANYLAYRREGTSEGREDLLRLAARAEFEGGRPPEEVANWLRGQGVEA